jgi:hypothetical protein
MSGIIEQTVQSLAKSKGAIGLNEPGRYITLIEMIVAVLL